MGRQSDDVLDLIYKAVAYLLIFFYVLKVADQYNVQIPRDFVSIRNRRFAKDARCHLLSSVAFVVLCSDRNNRMDWPTDPSGANEVDIRYQDTGLLELANAP